MVGNYSYSEYLNEVLDAARRSNIINVITARIPLNRAVRRVIQRVDLRSTKRNAVMASNLFRDRLSYQVPSDLKADAIIDIPPQTGRRTDYKLELVTQSIFDRNKTIKRNMVAVATDDLVKRILFSGTVDDTTLLMASLDTLTADGGTWIAVGDANTVVADADNKRGGGGSIKYDLTGSATTAGIQNTTLTTFDITNFTNDGVVYVWVYINSTTNLTNFIFDVGNDLTTNFYSDTVTTQFDSTAFVNGWNLLRFEFSGITVNGTITDTAIDSMRIYMTKTAGKSDDGYRFDHIEFHTGEIVDILYYSRFAWQSSGGTFLEDSTADTDLLNAETEEFQGFIFSAKMELFRETRRFDLVADAKNEYLEWREDYKNKNPTERLILTREYYRI